MKRWTKAVMLSTLACATLFGLSGCGSDKYAGDWTGWSSDTKISMVDWGNSTYLPKFYNVKIEKNGDGYLISANSYNYYRELKGTIGKERPIPMDYNYTLDETSLLKKTAISIKNNNVARFETPDGTVSLSYVEKDGTMLYSIDNRATITLKKDDKKVYEAFKKFMHDGLTAMAQSNNDPKSSGDRLATNRQKTTPRSINFDDSVYEKTLNTK